MDNTEELRSVAALAEPARRALYDYVASQPAPVGREEAAEATGMTRATAGFHLDRLLEAGLLETESRRLTGRRGPGAGRPAKLYRRARRDVAVSLPPRRYELAAQLLAESVEQALHGGRALGECLTEAARVRGATLGAAVRARVRARSSRTRVLASIGEVLAGEGYEPAVTSGEVTLRNCPFDALADRHRELVCGMNLDLLDGMARELSPWQVTAQLEPADGMCCVRVRA